MSKTYVLEKIWALCRRRFGDRLDLLVPLLDKFLQLKLLHPRQVYLIALIIPRGAEFLKLLSRLLKTFTAPEELRNNAFGHPSSEKVHITERYMQGLGLHALLTLWQGMKILLERRNEWQLVGGISSFSERPDGTDVQGRVLCRTLVAHAVGEKNTD